MYSNFHHKTKHRIYQTFKYLTIPVNSFFRIYRP